MDSEDVPARRTKRTDEGRKNATSESLVYVLFYEEGTTGDDPDEWEGDSLENKLEDPDQFRSLELAHDTKDNRDTKGFRYALKELSECLIHVSADPYMPIVQFFFFQSRIRGIGYGCALTIVIPTNLCPISSVPVRRESRASPTCPRRPFPFGPT